MFLTELATAGHTSCLVFDDPVSSLDHRWRRKVAERLIEEAGIRQIIVFTHDLVFLNDLQTLSRQRSIPIKEISLTQTIAGAGVVHEGLPWAGQKIPERLDNLEKDARAAHLLYEAHDDEVMPLLSQISTTVCAAPGNGLLRIAPSATSSIGIAIILTRRTSSA